MAGRLIVGFFVIVIGSWVDNILRPLLVGKDTVMPDYSIPIDTLGGMEIHGINGFVIGRWIAALFIACWNLLSGREHAGNTDEIDEEFIEEAKIAVMNSFPGRGLAARQRSCCSARPMSYQ